MHLHDQRTIIRPVLLIFGFRPFRYIYFIGNQIPTAGFREDASRTALQHRERAGRNIVEQNGNLLQGHLIPGTPRIEGLIADTLNTLSDNDRFQCGAFRKRFRGNLGNSIADISLLQTRTELGLIPKGWRVVSLGEVTKQITEKVGNREDVTVLSPINSGELVLSEEYFTKQVFSKDLSKYLIVNPLSFAYNPARINIGSIGLNTFDFVGCVSPVYVVFECEPNYQYFFDFFKRTAMFKDEVALRAIGGVRQSLGYNDLSLIKTIYPTSDVVVEFNNLYLKMKEVMIKNTDQNEKFISLRDSLLPKLMSGELKINEFNC